MAAAATSAAASVVVRQHPSQEMTNFWIDQQSRENYGNPRLADQASAQPATFTQSGQSVTPCPPIDLMVTIQDKPSTQATQHYPQHQQPPAMAEPPKAAPCGHGLEVNIHLQNESDPQNLQQAPSNAVPQQAPLYAAPLQQQQQQQQQQIGSSVTTTTTTTSVNQQIAPLVQPVSAPAPAPTPSPAPMAPAPMVMTVPVASQTTTFTAVPAIPQAPTNRLVIRNAHVNPVQVSGPSIPVFDVASFMNPAVVIHTRPPRAPEPSSRCKELMVNKAYVHKIGKKDVVLLDNHPVKVRTLRKLMKQAATAPPKLPQPAPVKPLKSAVAVPKNQTVPRLQRTSSAYTSAPRKSGRRHRSKSNYTYSSYYPSSTGSSTQSGTSYYSGTTESTTTTS